MNLKKIRNYYNYIYRNLKLGINGRQTVIDIGPGHAPLIRADVLCDLPPYEKNQRPVAGIYTPQNRFVVGDVHDLPFVSKAFDFAYSRAVLEHVANPQKVCEEISRIAHRGLLILPSYIWELMGGSEAHLWLISKNKDTLVFQRKTLKHTEFNSQIPEKIRNSDQYEKLFYSFYEYFYIDFYWEGRISIKVIDEEDSKNKYHLKENIS